MKLITNTNRSGKMQEGGVSTDAQGLKISPRLMGVTNFETFLVAKGLSDWGVGALIDPNDYFNAEKSKDVYALLCARPQTASIGNPATSVNVYPVFFIAHVAGMSDAFIAPGTSLSCRTLCLDVVQRVGVGDALAGMQSRIYLNLYITDSTNFTEGTPIVFRPSWDKFMSAPDLALQYADVTYDVEWPASPDNQLTLQVKNRDGGYLFGPWVYLCQTARASKLVLRTSDIPMENNWSIWCGEAGSEQEGHYQAALDFAASLSFPIARISRADGNGMYQSLIWMCLYGSYGPASGLIPIAYQTNTNSLGDVASPDLSIVYPTMRLR